MLNTIKVYCFQFNNDLTYNSNIIGDANIGKNVKI